MSFTTWVSAGERFICSGTTGAWTTAALVDVTDETGDGSIGVATAALPGLATGAATTTGAGETVAGGGGLVKT